MTIFNVDTTDPECLLSAFDIDEARGQVTVKLPKWCHALLESFEATYGKQCMNYALVDVMQTLVNDWADSCQLNRELADNYLELIENYFYYKLEMTCLQN